MGTRQTALRTAVWGTGNMGSGAIRSALHTPGIELAAIVTSSPDKVGRDASSFIGDNSPVGVAATLSNTEEHAAVLASVDAVAYMASGDIRPDEAVDDIEACLRAGCHVVTPAVYALYDPQSAPAELIERLTGAAIEGGASLFVSGVDPGWANDAMAVLAAGLCTNISNIRCQEIFDYSTYQQPYAVRELCGFGSSLDDTPMMLLEGVPTMVWGGNVRLIGRGLGIEIDEITEHVERRPLTDAVTNEMGEFAAGTQGAFRLQIAGHVAGLQRVTIDHITRITPDCAPEWPLPSSGAGEHNIVITGDPNLTITVHADVEGGTRADGGNATAVNRLLGAITWLADASPGIYDGLDIPLHPNRTPELSAQRWSS